MALRALASIEYDVRYVNRRTLYALMTIAMVATSVARVSARSEQIDSQQIKNPQTATRPKLVIRTEELFPLTPPTRIGVFKLLQPRNDGEFVRVAVPVGELISRAGRSISDANRRRAERNADARVRRDLEQFLAANQKQNRP